MQRISYALSVFIIFVAFIINGEGYQLYLSGVETQFPYATFKLPDGASQEEMIDHIKQVTEEYDVKVFTSKYSKPENNKSVKTFYADNETKKILDEEYNISEGEYPGILEGTLGIKYADIDDIPDVTAVDAYYFVGDMDNILEAYGKLNKLYEGSEPMEGYEMFDCNYYTVAVWIIAGIVILVLQLSAVLAGKKESMLRITFGESKAVLILKAVLQDFVFYLSAVLITYFLASKYTYAQFNIGVTVFTLLLIFVFDTMLNISTPFGNYKKVFSNISVSKNMLRLGYGLKIVSSVLVTIIVSMCIMFVAQGIEERGKKEFFERYKDYYYVHFTYTDNSGDVDTLIKSQEINETFYRKYFNECDAVQFAWWDVGGTAEEYVYATKNILWHLKDNISEIEDYDFEKEIYFMVPEGTDEDIIYQMKDSVDDIEGRNFEYEYDIIYYKGSIDLLVLDRHNLSGAVSLEKPYIIYNNIDANKATHKISETHGKTTVDSLNMYKIDKDKIQSFIEENGLENHICTVTNVWEDYEEGWKRIEQTTILSIILMILFIILESFVIKNILKLEYTANAVELSVKKVLGYGIFEKNKKLMFTTTVTSVICIVLSAVIADKLMIPAGPYILTGGFILLAVELFMILLAIRRLEKNSVQKILKGGAL